MRSKFTTERSRQTRPAVLVLALAAVAVVSVAGILVVLLQRQTATRAAPERLEPLDTGAVVWDLETDAKHDQLWFVVDTGLDERVMRVSLAPEKAAAELPTMTWPLPPGEYNGTHREVRVTPSGNVVISEDYSVLVLNPESGAISRAEFELDVADAQPGALDPNSPLPGTWISAIGVSAESIYVARNNVPYLTVLDVSTLEPVGRLDLDAERSGAHDVLVTDGTIWLRSASGDIARVPKNGGPVELAVKGVVAATALHGDTVVGSTQQGGLYAATAGGSPRIAATQRLNVVIATDSAGSLIAFDRRNSELVRYDPLTGNELGSVSVPLTRIPSRMGNEPVDVPPSIVDLVVDSSGSAWYSVGDDPKIYRVRGP